MKRTSVLSFALVLVAGMVLLSLFCPAMAAPIAVNDTFQYLYNYAPNTVGLSVGEGVKFGAYSVIPNGVQGTTGTGTLGSFTRTLTFAPNAAYPNRFHNGHDQAGISIGPSWTLTFTNGSDTTTVLTPDVAGVPFVPMVQNLTMSANGLTPTFTWTMPGGFTPDLVIAAALDHAQADPSVDPQNLVSLISTASSFTIPATFGLQPGHDYTFAVLLAATRDHAASFVEPDWLSVSENFLDFSVQAPGAVPEPLSLLLLGFGLSALAVAKKAKKRN